MVLCNVLGKKAGGKRKRDDARPADKSASDTDAVLWRVNMETFNCRLRCQRYS
jgi:hypothetical protein